MRLKDFKDFLNECVESDDFIMHQTEQLQGLTVEQACSVYRLILQLLGKYHEWLQE